MSTLRSNTRMSAAIRQLVGAAAVLLPFIGQTAAGGPTAGPSPVDDSRVAQPEVWICAGDRIMELLQPGANTANPLSPPSPPVTVPTEQKRVPDSPATQAELAKWDRADRYRSQTGPGGTEWDAPYRALIQTSESAVSKGSAEPRGCRPPHPRRRGQERRVSGNALGLGAVYQAFLAGLPARGSDGKPETPVC